VNQEENTMNVRSLLHVWANSGIVCTVALGTLTVCAQAVSPRPAQAPNPTPTQFALANKYGKLPLSFEANRGQSDQQVRFTSRGRGYSLFLTDTEAVLALGKDGAKQTRRAKPDQDDAKDHLAGSQLKTDVVRMQLAGANTGLRVVGEDRLPGVTNYFIGSDPAQWRSDVPTYAKVRYANVYPGVDLTYYGNQGRLEYDFVVAPGADPRIVRLHFAGAQKLKLSAKGDLRVIAKNGEIAFHKPVIYQPKSSQQLTESVNQRVPVDGKFTLLAGNTVGFELGSYDPNRMVVIDPSLEYTTYLGGSSIDSPAGIAVDAVGDAYVTGYTVSTDFPVTSGAFQTVNKKSSNAFTSNAFVAKLNSSGSFLLYSTYLGGTNSDTANAIAIDASGSAYVTGLTFSTDFPVTAGAFQTANNGVNGVENAFVTKLNPSGSALVYSTYLGGSSGDAAYSLALDASGAAYLTGVASSADFPVTGGAFQTANGAAAPGENAFVTKLSPDGTTLVYSTYLGGSANDFGADIAVDASGNAYIAGAAGSSNFPVTPGAFQTTNQAASNGEPNAFVTKLNATGSALLYSTYLGGSGSSDTYYSGDRGLGVAVDGAGNAYVAGVANSSNFPVTPAAFQTVNKAAKNGGTNAFVSKLNPQGTALIYSTYLGGSDEDGALGIAVDGAGDAYLTGFAGSTDFPVTLGAMQMTLKSPGGTNAFLTKLNPSGAGLTYSSFVGGSGTTPGDFGTAVALDRTGSPYLTGYTSSADLLVTPSAFQTINKTLATGLYTVFVTRFVNASARTSTFLTVDTNPQMVGVPVTFTANVVPVLGSGIPTGTVAFSVNNKGTSVEVALDNTGHASYTTSLPVGKHWMLATYSGDSQYGASITALEETITVNLPRHHP
jgi:hypothetical protein